MLYDLIYADPPWQFHVWDRDTGQGRSAEAHYPTMTLKEICDLPIKELCAPNCVLFLWTVWPSMFERWDKNGRLLEPSYPAEVMKAWGFTYKTLGFEWWKLNKLWPKCFAKDFNRVDHHWLERLFFFGMGYYTRTNSEPCLLATRGAMPVSVHNERNYILAPVREHSQKPDEAYEKIERLYPRARKLELFARRNRPGWDAFGNQVDRSISLPGIVPMGDISPA